MYLNYKSCVSYTWQTKPFSVICPVHQIVVNENVQGKRLDVQAFQ